MSHDATHELRRTVRVIVNPPGAPSTPSGNGFGGTPTPAGLCRHYEFEVACRGTPDPDTGYLVDIKRIDQAVRDGAGPILQEASVQRPGVDPPVLLGEMTGAIAHALDGLDVRVIWRLTPYHVFEMASASIHAVLIRERFDFAASHRLHTSALSDEENRAVFGKCNNPNGHGHNYQVEPCVEVDLDRAGEAPFSLGDLERLTRAHVIDAYDHTHLNLDTEAFASDGGVIPSVENIARVSFDRLAQAVRDASPAATLRSVTVWETDRTSCTYPANITS